MDRLSPVPGKQLVQWNGSFTDLTNVKRTLHHGRHQSSTPMSPTNYTVWVIPVKFVFDTNHGNKPLIPTSTMSNGQTVTQNTLKSPLFNAGIDFKQGATDLGNTQYIDAFQRGTLWGKNVKTNNKYHVLLKPVLSRSRPSTAPTSAARSTPFNFGLPEHNCRPIRHQQVRSLIQGFMRKLGATPDITPLFIWYDIYLTGGTGLSNCCIGGYHGANGAQPGGQTYNNAAYADVVGIFSQDVSAMSHELGEWMDDPFTDTASTARRTATSWR